jgi:PPE-repeat protein
VVASTGNAGVVGKLAVPPAWTESVPEATTTAAVAPGTAPVPAAAAPAGHGAGVAGAGLAGLAAGRSGRRRGRGDRGEANSERIADQLTGAGEVRHWHVEPGGLKSLLGEVAGQPGVHEVYFDTAEQVPPDTGPQPGRG